MDDEPRFARFAEGGRVHVLRAERHTILHTLGDLPAADPDQRPPLVNMNIAYLMGRNWALCGKIGAQGGTDGISHFDDADLCQRCYRAWPHDTSLLFEHPQNLVEEMADM